MYPRLFVLCVVGMLVLCVAQDVMGQRVGWIGGIGLGPGIVSYEKNATQSETAIAFGGDFRGGYAFHDQFGLYALYKISFFGVEDETVQLSWLTLSGTYWLKPAAPTFYLNGGIGFSVWEESAETIQDSDSDARSGIGLVLGGGYEFAKHFSIGIDLTYSSLSLKESIIIIGEPRTITAFTLSATIGWLAY